MEFTMPLGEAMETQRAIRRLKPDPVDEGLVLRLIDLALRAPTGSNAQNWEFIVVRDPKVKKGLARLNRQAWGPYGRIGRWVTRRDPTQAQDPECRSMAGGSLRGNPSHRCRLSEGAVRPFSAHLRGNLLWLHLSFRAEPASGCTCRGPGCCPHHHPIVEPFRCPQSPRPSLEHHTVCGDPPRLAAWAVRPYDAKTSSRGRVLRSLRESIGRLTTRCLPGPAACPGQLGQGPGAPARPSPRGGTSTCLQCHCP